MPAAFATVSREALAPLVATLEGAGCLWYPTLGLGFVTGEPRAAGETAAAIASARTKLAAGGGSLVLHAAPEPVRKAVDVWGAPPAALGLMKSVKSRLDPERRFAPGRFVGGI